MVASLNLETLHAYRAETYRLRRPIARREEAVAFVRERGFIYFWPIKEVALPSLWVAVAGDRPVADAHDDPGHITWGWKDDLLGKRVWYYAKVLRRRATIIALDVLPCFYALSENYGEPEKDYLLQYDEGRLSFEAKTIYETLLAHGPLDTISLRKLAHMTSQASDSPFSRALDVLQADFKVLPVGVAEAGAWKYAFIYECVHRHYPDLAEQARSIRQADARRRLAELYLRSVGAARERDFVALFGWPRRDVAEALQALIRAGIVCGDVSVAGTADTWVALAELVE